MATGLPMYFTGGQGSLVSYNSIDIITGTGYITLYGGDSNAGTRSLSNMTFYSDIPNSNSCNTGTVAYTKGGDYDFDVLCNKPMTLQGKAIINVPFCFDGGLGDNAYIITRVRKYNGAETELGLSTASQTIASSNVGPVGDITCTSCAIPLTGFKKGEYIRITVEVWANRPGGGGSAGLWIFYDPMGRTTYNGIPVTIPTNMQTTQMKVLLPVRIDL